MMMRTFVAAATLLCAARSLAQTFPPGYVDPAPLLAAAALGISGCNTVPAAAPRDPVASVTVTTATKAPYGAYLVDGAGRALYILEGARGAGGTERCGVYGARPSLCRVYPMSWSSDVAKGNPGMILCPVPYAVTVADERQFIADIVRSIEEWGRHDELVLA